MTDKQQVLNDFESLRQGITLGLDLGVVTADIRRRYLPAKADEILAPLIDYIQPFWLVPSEGKDEVCTRSD